MPHNRILIVVSNKYLVNATVFESDPTKILREFCFQGRLLLVSTDAHFSLLTTKSIKCNDISLILDCVRYSSKLHLILLKAELRISNFQHFHWLAGHRLSVHIRNASAIKRAENIFAALRKETNFPLVLASSHAIQGIRTFCLFNHSLIHTIHLTPISHLRTLLRVIFRTSVCCGLI